MTARCVVHRLGQIAYGPAWELQKTLAVEIAQGRRPPTLLLLEHPHTYTFGRRGTAANLLWSEAELAQRDVAIHWVDRGGDVTYHGPGQLIGYPLLPLSPLAQAGEGAPPRADYVGYLRRLEAAIILALAQLGLDAFRLEGLTGVWVPPLAGQAPAGQPGKIAALGVKVDAHGVTRHGFALNVNPDMVYWQGIIACGLPEHPAVSLADFFNPPPALGTVQDQIVAAFGNIFCYTMVEQELDENLIQAQNLLED